MLKSPKQQIILLASSSILAAFSLGSIINFTDPFASSWPTKLFFYISLFLLALSLFSIIGIGIRQWFWPKLYVVNLSASFRQALLLSILLLCSAILLATGLLYWWVELTLVLFFLAIEAFLNLKI